ncbi:MAG: PepSY domain-containing protein [Gammaproteobacteria bacterium]
MTLRFRIHRAVLIGLLWIAPAAAMTHSPLYAASVEASMPVAIAAAADRRISLDQAVAMVLRRYGGKVISAETRTRNGRVIHRIKVLTENGRVRTVRVDGQTGAIS